MNPQVFLEYEYKLLGAYTTNPDLFDGCSHLVSTNLFTSNLNIYGYMLIKSLHEKNIPPDPSVMYGELIKAGLKHEDCLLMSKWESGHLTSEKVIYFVTSLFSQYVSRFLVPKLENAHSKLREYGQDSLEVMEDIKTAITDVELVLNNVSREKSIHSVFDEAVQRIVDLKNNIIRDTGFSWGLKELDGRTGGICRGVSVIGATPGSGKCLGYGTKIVMFDGSLKEVQNIKEGDLIMGVDSTPRKVLSLARGVEEMFWIKQKQGIDYRVNKSHILSLKASHNTKKIKNGDVLNIPVSEFLTFGKYKKQEYKGYKLPVEFSEKQLPLDPYFLGIWLGDGTASKPEITTPDVEVVNYLYEFAFSIGLKVTETVESNKCPRYNIVKPSQKFPKGAYSLHSHLKELNLFNNKHIPKNYLCNSTENRLKLLAGLLDTDGHYDGNSSYEIIQKDTNLANQIKFLADSLGFKTSIQKKIGKIKSTGFSAEYNRIHISGNVDIIPLKINRKKAVTTNKNKNWRVNGIEVVSDGIGEYYGFTLDKDGLFFLEDFTVTHNTSMLINIIIKNCIDDNIPLLFFSLEMPAVEIMTNIISNYTEINSRALRQGSVDEIQIESIQTMRERLKNNFEIDETGGITWQYVQAKTRAFRKKHKIPADKQILVLLDYLQLMGNSMDEKKFNDERQVEIRCNEITRIAKNDNLAFVLLSQFSRMEKDRKIPRPKISDLKGSGAIEACAILILLLFRPDYHGIFTDDKGRDLRGLCEINPAKGRYIKPEPVYAVFEGKYSRFRDYVPEPGIIADNGQNHAF